MARSLVSARSFFRDPVGYVRDRGGDATTLRLAAGPARFVLVRDPEAIWRVLVTDADAFRPGKWKRRAARFLGPTLNTLDAAEHRARRLLLQPALDRRRVATFGPAITERAERMRDGWTDGARIRLRDDLDRLAVEVAGDVLLSTDLGEISGELARSLARVMRSVPRATPPLRATPGGRALTRVEQLVDGLIAERRGQRADGDDLLAALLRDGLPPRTVRGEVIAFLLAAVDEPPSALEAAWFLLGRNPACDDRLHAELRGGARSDPRELPYLRAVLRETLRLFPPARHIDRCPHGDVQVADARVAAGANVLVSPLVTHREPGLYPRPEDFVPERWLGDAARNGSRGVYVPFGAGAHACIGEPLAMALMTLTLAAVARRWRLRVDPDAEAPGPRTPGLAVTLERR